MSYGFRKTNTELVEENLFYRIDIWEAKRFFKDRNKLVEQAIENNEYLAVYLQATDDKPETRILIDYTPTPFGGYKLWFVCPVCWKNKMYLYNSFFGGLKCRECHNYKYLSQYPRTGDYILLLNTCHEILTSKRRMIYAGNDVKGRLDLLSLLTEELSAGETVVDVEDKTKIRYALYLRKSTEGEYRQEKSIEDQKTECFKNIIDRYGIKITENDIYIDKKSAKISGNRPAFDRMIKRIKKGDYDGIIAWHYDRLARNMKEAGEIIDLIDEGKIVDLQLVTAHFENNPNGKMILGINFVLSKHYSDHL